jgi:hypothetical protein
MISTSAVLLIDDGELEDVRVLLEGFDTPFVHFRGKEVPEEVEDPRNLLVTTARRAVTLQFSPEQKRPRPPVRIAVCNGSSKTQRSILKRAGFDYLVSRPVHPVALRLLLMRAIYRGREKREATRYAFGYEVTFRTGFRRRKAVVAEVSAVGCRLLTPHNVSPGTAVTVQLPRQLVGGKGIDLRARVVRVDAAEPEGGKKGEYSVGFKFERLDDDTKSRLRSVLTERYWGPAMLPGEVTPPVAPPTAEPEAARKDLEAAAEPEPPVMKQPEEVSAPVSAPDEPEPAEVPPAVEEAPPVVRTWERRHERASYEKEVIAVGTDATRVLVGRDLSMGGMRVDPHPRLEVGDRIRVAIYASSGEDPFVVEARVLRDDAERGIGLRFDWMDGDAEQRLGQLLGTLPSIEALGAPEAKPLVLSEIVSEPRDTQTR